tara:strand:- start:16 stop:297 length:282 start_codon:yes stop_codon:yes gene_type:complete
MNLNIIAWIVVMFFALGWTYGMTKEYYRTRGNMLIVMWWWFSIGGIIFLKLSPFHLFYIMPLAALFMFIIPGLLGSIALIIIISAVYYFTYMF